MKIAILSFLLVLLSCTSSKSTISAKQLIALKEVVEMKNFEVISNWAQPLGINNGVQGLQVLMPPGSNTNNISLIGNPNFFKVNNDSIHMELPYFGQQRMPKGYNTNVGINFKGKINKYKAAFDEKKKAYILKYSVKGKDDNYNAVLTLFSNNKSMLSINSSNRTSINYIGKWKNFK